MRRAILSLAAFVLVSACGTASDSPILNLTRAALDQVRQGGARPGVDEQKAAIIEALQASGVTDPVLLVTLPKRQAVATLVVAGENGDAVTWRDATGVSVVTRRGVVIETRGLGFDVMASDMSGTVDALARGGSGYVRLQRFLDGEGHLLDRPLTCAAERTGATLTETCGGNGATVTNIFELRGGRVVSSRQWLGSGIGYAEITRLQ